MPAVDFQKAKSEVNRLRAVVDTERIERERNLSALEDAAKKLEAQMKNSEIRAPMDGLLTNITTIDGELVGESNELFTVASRKTYVRGEVNEEDVGAVKIGMKANIQLYAYQTQQFVATVSSIQPAADPETQRYTVVLQMERSPDNLMSGMTGEMNIITGTHKNVLLVPSRAVLVDQVLVVSHGIVQKRTVKVGYHTLDTTEVTNGLSLGDRVVVADQDRIASRPNGADTGGALLAGQTSVRDASALHCFSFSQPPQTPAPAEPERGRLRGRLLSFAPRRKRKALRISSSIRPSAAMARW